jgi:hypothetical protein
MATIPSGFSEYHKNETPATKTQNKKKTSSEMRVTVSRAVPNRLYLFFEKMETPTQRRNITILIVPEECEQKEVTK